MDSSIRYVSSQPKSFAINRIRISLNHLFELICNPHYFLYTSPCINIDFTCRETNHQHILCHQESFSGIVVQTLSFRLMCFMPINLYGDICLCSEGIIHNKIYDIAPTWNLCTYRNRTNAMLSICIPITCPCSIKQLLNLIHILHLAFNRYTFAMRSSIRTGSMTYRFRKSSCPMRCISV